MPDLKLQKDLTTDEILRYMKIYVATTRSIAFALAKFKTISQYGLNQLEKDDARLRSLELKRDQDLIMAKYTAFDTNIHGIIPPSGEQVQAAQDLSTRLAAVQAHDGQVNAILAMVNEALTAFQQVQPG